jgi:hypothetical protein
VKKSVRDCNEFTGFQPHEDNSVVFGTPFVRFYIYARLASDWTVGFYSSYLFENLTALGWCLINTSVLATKNRGLLQESPRNTKLRSSGERLYRLWLNFSNLCRPSPHIKPHSCYVQENKITPSRGRNAKYEFARKELHQFSLNLIIYAGNGPI